MESDITEQKTGKSHLWKKGQSGNLKGRPPGVKSLKGFAREYLLKLSDEEKDEFLDSLPKQLVWQMAEGNPDNKQEIKHEMGTAFTTEEIEAAKQIIVNKLNGKQNVKE